MSAVHAEAPKNSAEWHPELANLSKKKAKGRAGDPSGQEGVKEVLQAVNKKIEKVVRDQESLKKTREALDRFELRRDLQRVVEAYEEADTPKAFADYMLHTSDFKLSAEGAEKVRDALARILKNEGLEEKDLEKLISQLPTEINYKNSAVKKEKETSEKEIYRVREKIKKGLAMDESYEATSELKGIEEGRKGAEMDESEIEKEELKKIEKERIKKEKIAAKTSEDASAVAGEIANAEKINPEEKKEREEFEVEELKPQKKLAKEALEEKVKNAPLVRQAKEAKTTGEFLDSILIKRAGGIEKRMKEIRSFFKSGGDKQKHEMLMGGEVKGWFKWKAKRLQKEYQELFENPVYQSWLKFQKLNTEKRKAA